MININNLNKTFLLNNTNNIKQHKKINKNNNKNKSYQPIKSTKKLDIIA